MYLRRRLLEALAGALLLIAALASGHAPADAHALLTASTPADGATVEQPPDELLLTFTEPLDPELSSVTLLDSSGQPIEAGRAEPVAGQPAQLRVPLGDLAQGLYTATWRVTSPSDGHTTVGAVAFGVGVPATAAGLGAAGSEVRAPSPTAASVAGRWLFYVGAVLMLGAAVMGAAVLMDPRAISRRALAAAWLAAAAGVAVTMGDQRASAQTSLGMFLSSSTGRRLATQAAAVALAGAAVVWALRRPSRRSLAAVGVGAGAAMLARALAGHANASAPRWFTVGTQWVHLVAVGVWVGGLVWMLIAMRHGDRGRGPGLVRRFSSVAAVTLAVVAVSGVARALDEVGAWAQLVDTNFGVTLLIKVGLFAGLVALGALSRFRHVPAAAAGRPSGLRRVVRGEVALAAGVLGATALMTGFPPSSTVAAASKGSEPPVVTVTGNDYGTSVRVRLEVTPGAAGQNEFQSTVEDYDSGEPVPARSVSLRFQLAGRPDVAAATLDLAPGPDAQWQGSGNVLSIDGRWTVTALVETPSDAVEVPMELVTRPAPSQPADSGGICRSRPGDPSYSISFETQPAPVRAEGTNFTIAVRQDGRPVAGAQVCVRVNMPDMDHPGVSARAREASPGTYEARLRFSMPGAWSGSVIVAEPGKPAVSVPIKFEVT